MIGIKFEQAVWEPPAQETDLQPAWRQSQERVTSSASQVGKLCPISKNTAIKRAGTALEAGLMRAMLNAAKKLEMVQVQLQQRKVVDQDSVFLTEFIT